MSSVQPKIRGAGLLIYRKNANFVEYLLLQSSGIPHHWTPPKGFLFVGLIKYVFLGHVDPGENEWQAAIREVKEESGIDANEKLTLIKDFKHEMFYYVNSELKRVCEKLNGVTIGRLGRVRPCGMFHLSGKSFFPIIIDYSYP